MEFIYVKLHITFPALYLKQIISVSQQCVKDYQELRKDVNLGSIYG